MYMLCSKFVQQQIHNETVGLGTPKLSLSRIKKLQIPLPPLDVQQEVVNEFERAEGEERELYEQVGQIKAHREELVEKC